MIRCQKEELSPLTFRALNPNLFGSFARNEQKDDSDIDILVSLKAPSLYLYAGLKSDLESILSREVDVI